MLLIQIGHDETEIAGACDIDARVVDLIENSMAQREPDTAVAADRCTQAALRTRRPSCGNTRPARGKRPRVFSHNAISC